MKIAINESIFGVVISLIIVLCALAVDFFFPLNNFLIVPIYTSVLFLIIHFSFLAKKNSNNDFYIITRNTLILFCVLEGLISHFHFTKNDSLKLAIIHLMLKSQEQEYKNNFLQPRLWIDSTEMFRDINLRVYSKQNITSRYIRLRENRPNWKWSGKMPKTQFQLRDDKSSAERIYSVSFDENGFMEIPKNDVPKLKIYFLGGSTTECWYVSDTLRFPYLVKYSIERQTDMLVNTFNAGKSGNHTIHSLNVLVNKIVDKRPDYVVLMHGINDLVTLWYEGSYWNDNASRSLIVDLLSHSKPTTSDEWESKRNNLPPLKDVEKEIERQFENALLSFIDFCKRWNIKPVLMTQQNRILEDLDLKVHHSMLGALDQYDDFARVYSNLNNITRQVANSNDVPLIDLDIRIPKTNEYIYDIVHLNDNGSKLVSEIISDFFLAQLKVEELKNSEG